MWKERITNFLSTHNVHVNCNNIYSQWPPLEDLVSHSDEYEDVATNSNDDH